LKTTKQLINLITKANKEVAKNAIKLRMFNTPNSPIAKVSNEIYIDTIYVIDRVLGEPE